MVWAFKWLDKTRSDELKRLAKERKNAKFESIMKNLKPSDLMDSSKMTLLHWAIKYNNLSLTTFLLECGCPINAQNSSGQTPLMFAVLYDRFNAIKLLLEADANVYIADFSGKTPLQVAIKQRVPNTVIEYFFKSLKKIGTTAEMIANVFEEAGCSLRHVLPLNDSQLLQEMLELERSIDLRESCALVKSAMQSTSIENVENLIALTHYGIGRHFRKDVFQRELSYRIESSSPHFDYVKSLLNQLIALNAIDEDLIRYFGKVFERKKSKAVQLLLDCKVHVHVNVQFERDLTAHLFGNRNVDAIELLRNGLISRPFWGMKGRRGFSALHFAVKANLNKNVRYLSKDSQFFLSNARDDRGMTPLFFAKNVKCVELLLQSDADVQAIDSDGSTIFDVNQCSITRQMLIAHLTCLEAQGVTIKQEIYASISSNEKLRNFYDKCRSQIEFTKNSVIFKVVPLFTVLTEKVEVIARYLRYGETTPLNLSVYKRQLHWFYYSRLKEHLQKAMRIRRLYCRASMVIAECIELFAADHLVVEKIVSYLSHKDMLLFE